MDWLTWLLATAVLPAGDLWFISTKRFLTMTLGGAAALITAITTVGEPGLVWPLQMLIFAALWTGGVLTSQRKLNNAFRRAGRSDINPRDMRIRADQRMEPGEGVSVETTYELVVSENVGKSAIESGATVVIEWVGSVGVRNESEPPTEKRRAGQ